MRPVVPPAPTLRPVRGPRPPAIELDTRRLLRFLWRAVRLRCPHCGERGLFRGRLTPNERCASCGIYLERGEPDHFIGAYVLNLAAVELLLVAVLVSVAIATWPDVPWGWLQWGGAALAVLAGVACYPFARATWLAVDITFRPVTAAELDIAGGMPREIAEELV